jgi:hypothetical protein
MTKTSEENLTRSQFAARAAAQRQFAEICQEMYMRMAMSHVVTHVARPGWTGYAITTGTAKVAWKMDGTVIIVDVTPRRRGAETYRLTFNGYDARWTRLKPFVSNTEVVRFVASQAFDSQPISADSLHLPSS